MAGGVVELPFPEGCVDPVEERDVGAWVFVDVVDGWWALDDLGECGAVARCCGAGTCSGTIGGWPAGCPAGADGDGLGPGVVVEPVADAVDVDVESVVAALAAAATETVPNTLATIAPQVRTETR